MPRRGGGVIPPFRPGDPIDPSDYGPHEPSAEERGGFAGVSEAVRKYVLGLWGLVVNDIVKLEKRVVALEEREKIRDEAVDEVAMKVLGKHPKQ